MSTSWLLEAPCRRVSCFMKIWGSEVDSWSMDSRLQQDRGAVGVGPTSKTVGNYKYIYFMGRTAQWRQEASRCALL